MRPVLFYMIGYPGAGKTTLASKLSFLLGGVHLRADTIGLELLRFPTYSPRERQMVYAEMNRRAQEQLIAGQHVLYDAAANTAAQRVRIVTLARQHGAMAIGLWVQTPAPVAKRRAATVRDQGVVGHVARVIPPHIFDQYVTAFEQPAAGEQVIILSGIAPFALQYRRLQRQLDGGKLPRLVQ